MQMFLDLHNGCFILSDANVMQAVPQALEIIFEVQMKRSSNKK
jgi:hypothetical protein